MALLHLAFEKSPPLGGLLRRHLDEMESGFRGLNQLLGTMALLIDGDGSQASHFVTFADRFGFPNDGADAKAAWEELNSAMAKLNTDSSVSSVNAALLQLFNKLRG